MKYSLLKLSALAAIMNTAHAAFRGNSTVVTPDGVKKIKHLDVGEHVNAYSPLTDARGRAVVLAKALSNEFQSVVDIDLGHRTVRAFAHQKVFDVGGHYFIRAKDLTPNKSILLGQDGSMLDVLGIKKKRASCFSTSDPYEVIIDTRDHAFFVDGILCHNGHEVSKLADATETVMIFEGVKRGALAGVPPPLLIAGGVGLKLVRHAANQINVPGPHEYVPDSFSDIEHDLPPSLRDDLLPPPLEIAPAAAPVKRAVNQDAVQKWRQAQASDRATRAVHMVEPTRSNKNARIQVPVGQANDIDRQYQEQKGRELYAREMKEIQDRKNGSQYKWQAKKEAEAKRQKELPQNPNKQHSVLDEAEALARKNAGLPYKEGERPAVDPLENMCFLPVDPVKRQEEKMRILERMGANRLSEQAEKAPVVEAAPRVIKATPEQIEAINKMVGTGGEGLLKTLKASQPQAPAAQIAELPPHIAVDVVSKAHLQAGENRRAKQMDDHLERMRRAEAQQLYDRARNNEGMAKQRDAQRAQQNNDELIKRRFLAASNKFKK